MTIHIALLRSMVVNGHRVKGEDIRGLAAAIGATDVRSVGATGNLLFRSRKASARLERELEAACAHLYGKPTEVVVKTAAEWRALLKANPFPGHAAGVHAAEQDEAVGHDVASISSSTAVIFVTVFQLRLVPTAPSDFSPKPAGSFDVSGSSPPNHI